VNLERKGRFHGYGVKTWPDGDKYKGSFSKGMENGYGTLYYKGTDKSSKVRGWWTNGRKEGVCVQYNRKGKKESVMIYNDNEAIMRKVLLKEKLEKCAIF